MVDKLQDEPGRLAALDRYSILDTQPEAHFDRITSLVQSILEMPTVAVSLVSKDRQWFKSRQGITAPDMPRETSFCTQTIKSYDAMIVPNALAHPLFADNPFVLGAPYIRSYIGVPLRTPDGYNVGSLCATDTKPRQFDAGQVEIMNTLAALVTDEMELRLLAHTDYLTGVLSRRAFVVEMERAFARFARQGEPAAVLVLDLDRFKRVNDTWGHPAGDAVLTAVASCCGAQVRADDALGRLGGEEFAILACNATLEQATRTAERYRRSIGALKIDVLPSVSISASFGVAALTTDDSSLDTWLARADAAMYQAKQSGRDRVCVSVCDHG